MTDIKEALAALAHLPGQAAGAPKCCAYAHTTVRAALQSVAQEREDWRAIEGRCQAHEYALHIYAPYPGMSLWEANLAYQDERFTGTTRAEAVNKAATFAGVFWEITP